MRWRAERAVLVFADLALCFYGASLSPSSVWLSNMYHTRYGGHHAVNSSKRRHVQTATTRSNV